MFFVKILILEAMDRGILFRLMIPASVSSRVLCPGRTPDEYLFN